MQNYKNEIIRLRSEGKTYDEIKAILGCSKGTIAYHCGKGQRQKSVERQIKRRENPILRKTEVFKNDSSRKTRKSLENRLDHFQRGSKRTDQRTFDFTWEDILKKFKDNPTCYLSGRKIDFNSPKSYSFDHIIAYSKGGESTLENLGITCREANMAKSDLSVEDLIKLCKDILTHNGYEVGSAKRT